MKLTVEKPKPPHGRGYALKTSMVEQVVGALELANELEINLCYWTPSEDGTFFHALYWLPNDRIPHRRVYLRAGSLPRPALEVARDAMPEIVMPGFSTWLRQLNGMDDWAPQLLDEPRYEAIVRNGGVEIRSRP